MNALAIIAAIALGPFFPVPRVSQLPIAPPATEALRPGESVFSATLGMLAFTTLVSSLAAWQCAKWEFEEAEL
jgi:hypothetical protein